MIVSRPAGLSRRVFVIVLTCAALSFASACGGDATAPAGVHGTYSLAQANFKPVPATVLVEGDYTFEVRAGSYVLRENGTFSSAVTYHESFRGWTHLETHSFDGTFTLSADTVTFFWPGEGDTWRGMLAAGELTVIDNGITYLFRKGQ